MEFPSQLVKNAVDQLSTLPGVGKRSALRLALHLLKKDKEKVEKFGQSFIDLINNINYCKECFTISDFDLCQVCTNPNRDKGIICVVEDIRTMMAIENTLQYKGVYHVLGGLISPLDGIVLPSDIKTYPSSSSMLSLTKSPLGTKGARIGGASIASNLSPIIS